MKLRFVETQQTCSVFALYYICVKYESRRSVCMIPKKSFIRKKYECDNFSIVVVGRFWKSEQ